MINNTSVIVSKDLLSRSNFSGDKAIDKPNYDKYLLKIDEYIQDVVDSVIDCGFNTVLMHGSFDRILQLMDAIPDPNESQSNSELKVIVGSGFLYNSPNCCMNALRRFMQNPKAVAYQIKDEPKPESWGDVFNSDYNVCTNFNQLTLGYGMTSSIDPNKLTLFNLAAEATKEWIGSFAENTSGYSAYLDNLQKLFNPRIWSYDLYPINAVTVDEHPTGEIIIEYSKFYRYLNLFSKHCKKNDSKFWAYAMCMEHKIYNEKGSLDGYKPAPTTGELRFEVFNALAFGAQGIVYYQYGIGNHKTQNVGQVDVMAPVSFEIGPLYEGDDEHYIINLNKSDIWYRVKQVNAELAFWSPYFLGAKVLSYRHWGNHPPYGGIPLLVGSFGCISRISCFDSNGIELPTIPAETTGVFVSWFENTNPQGQKRNYIAIVNEDPINQQRIRVHVDPYAYSQIVNVPSQISRSQSEYIFANNTGKDTNNTSVPDLYVDFILKPGDMRLIYWDTERNYPIPEI